MNKIISQSQLRREIAKAGKREYNDDHLTPSERKRLVSAYKKIYPTEKLPKDLDDAYIEIIF